MKCIKKFQTTLFVYNACQNILPYRKNRLLPATGSNKTKSWELCSVLCRFRTNLRGLVFFYETFLDFIQNIKRFRSEGSSCVSRGRTFLSFVDFFNHFFQQFNWFGRFLTSVERFWGVQEKTYLFLECTVSTEQLIESDIHTDSVSSISQSSIA